MSRARGPRLELVPSPDGGASEGARSRRSGSSAPFDELYARHAGYVAGLAGRILGRDHEIADVVQDVFLIAHRRLGDLRNPDSARAWLGRITAREASRRLRRRRLGLFFGRAEAVGDDLVVDPTAAPDLRPLVALLYAALDRLPARERIAWVLRHLMEEPLDTVAETCGCSLATAKRRIAAAERVLRPIVSDDDAEPEESER